MSNILYLAEQRDGTFRKPTLELSSYARAMADLTGGEVTALVLGPLDPSEPSRLGTYGTDKILHAVQGPFEHFDQGIWTAVIASAAEKAGAQVLLFPFSQAGRSVAPAVAVRMQAALAAGVTSLPETIHPFIVHRKVYSGKAFARVELTTPRQVLTLSPNSFELREVSAPAVVETWEAPQLPSPFAKVLESSQSKGQLLLTEADIVVSGGRGMRGPEHWKPLEELAGALGAATACSRPVSDEGWRPHAEHVGQTGKIVAPNLYIACGISGAVQHLAGINSSKVIVAINKDPEAPIFGAADYGIIGDVHQVLPALADAARKFRENS